MRWSRGSIWSPTFLDFFGGDQKPHIIEGRSLQPLLHDRTAAGRDHVISEYDYATRQTRLALGVDEADARLLMLFDGRWKYIHAEGFRPLLFDLETDAEELVDLGADPGLEEVRARLHETLFAWARRHHCRITLRPEQIDRMAYNSEPRGILIGFWDEDEVRAAGLKTVYPRID